MATLYKFLTTIFLLSLISQGNCQCYPVTSLKLFQSQTGLQVHNMRHWRVTIFNDCFCPQYNIKLDCYGLGSIERIDPSVLALSGVDGCRVNNNGQIMYGQEAISFTYSWHTRFQFKPIDSQMACS